MDVLRKSLVIAYLLLSVSLWPQYIALNQVINDTDTILFWDPILEQGSLELGKSNIMFKLNSEWIVIDSKEKIKTESFIRNDEGEILVPEATSEKIVAFFKERAMDSVETPRISAIIIDPGHGGKDPGAQYTYKYKNKKTILNEKDITLDISLQLAKRLEKEYPDKRIVLTRKNDDYIRLEERIDTAHTIAPGKHEALLYISVHVNAAFNRKAKGYEVWYLPSDYRRNLLDGKSVKTEEKEVLPILNTMLEEEYTIESVSLAKEILKGLDGTIGDQSQNLGLKAESWFVVRNTKMPSVLIETGFLSNEQEANNLGNKNYLNKIAQGIYNGISGFVSNFEKAKGITE